MRRTWEQVTKTLTTDEGLNNKQRVQFHYFNPNGIYEVAKTLYKEIDRAVDLGLCKTGAILVYGSLSTYGYNRMNRLANKKQVGSIEVSVWLNMWQEEIDRGYEFLLSLDGGTNEKANT